MAGILDVARSSYYNFEKTNPEKEKKEEEIKCKIKNIFNFSRKTYGVRRVTVELNRQTDNKINHKKVARIMKEADLKPKAKKKFKSTTKSYHDYPISENLLKREFKPAKPNMVWTSDITYIKTKEGWLYLTIIMDLFSKKIIGYSMDNNMKKEMVIKALDMAYTNRKPKEGLIFHSDRGVQYASYDFREKLDKYKMIQSMSRKGNCWDNAPTESFFHTLKVEEVYFKDKYSTRKEAKACVFEYINVFYNKQRIHSSINYMTPYKFEEEYYCLCG